MSTLLGKNTFGALICALACSSVAVASTITFTGSGTSSGGNPENASVNIVTGAGTVTVTLFNLLSNPNDVGQNISDLFFSLSNGATSGTLSSSSGTELTVNSGGTYVVGSTVTTGWVLTSMGTSVLLEVLGTPEAPAHTIIGTSSNGTYSGGTYSNANASIAGNGPHNPFLESGATFLLSFPTVTASTTVTTATFSFGTAAGNTLTATASGSATATPEEVPTALVGVGLLAIGILRRRAASYLFARAPEEPITTQR